MLVLQLACFLAENLANLFTVATTTMYDALLAHGPLVKTTAADAVLRNSGDGQRQGR